MSVSRTVSEICGIK